MKPPNNPSAASAKADGSGGAEEVEGRDLVKENARQAPTPRTQSRDNVSRGLAGVREAARRDRRARFTALLHHITPSLLTDCFLWLKRQAAPGVDGVTWVQYEDGLGARIADLHARVQRGAYRALPSRRTYIPKADGRMRPLGIAALEDKIVQAAVVKVLESIYEEDFLGFSYGFRPGRSQHQALDALWVGLTEKKVNWVLDADIRGFFDTINHDWLLKLIEHRIADPRMLRLIRKWLKAGVSEDGEWSETKVGTPQGAVISPLLANVFLHYVLDLWVNQWRRKHATGDVIIVRYADDFVLGFQHRDEAERFLVELRERLARFGLDLHPEKTRLIEFGRYAAERRKQRSEGKPETFNFLGFTHMCGVTWRTRRFTVVRRTMRKRLTAKLHAVKEQLRRIRHQSIFEQATWLCAVIRGYFNYHAIPGNRDSLVAFRFECLRLWQRSLRSRGDTRPITWAKIGAIAASSIPRPRILHPYPDRRFHVTYPRQEPYAGKPLVRICAGGAG
jgi:group II intron reverse transcriptase/maturase